MFRGNSREIGCPSHFIGGPTTFLWVIDRRPFLFSLAGKKTCPGVVPSNLAASKKVPSLLHWRELAPFFLLYSGLAKQPGSSSTMEYALSHDAGMGNTPLPPGEVFDGTTSFPSLYRAALTECGALLKHF